VCDYVPSAFFSLVALHRLFKGILISGPSSFFSTNPMFFTFVPIRFLSTVHRPSVGFSCRHFFVVELKYYFFFFFPQAYCFCLWRRCSIAGFLIFGRCVPFPSTYEAGFWDFEPPVLSSPVSGLLQELPSLSGLSSWVGSSLF